MIEVTLDTLTHRLDRLERENRWWRRLVNLCIFGVVAVAIMGQAPAAKGVRILEAEKFVLRDGSGKARAALMMSPSGTPHFWLAGPKDGQPRVMLESSPDGTASVSLVGDGGKVRALLQLDAAGAPSLWLRDRSMKLRTTLMLSADGSPLLGLADTKGELRATLTLSADDSPLLGFYDTKGHGRALLGLTSAGVDKEVPDLHMLDKDGKVIWKAP